MSDFNDIQCEGGVDFLTDVLRDKKPRGDDCQHQEVRGDMVAGKQGDDGLCPLRAGRLDPSGSWHERFEGSEPGQNA